VETCMQCHFVPPMDQLLVIQLDLEPGPCLLWHPSSTPISQLLQSGLSVFCCTCSTPHSIMRSALAQSLFSLLCHFCMAACSVAFSLISQYLLHDCTVHWELLWEDGGSILEKTLDNTIIIALSTWASYSWVMTVAQREWLVKYPLKPADFIRPGTTSASLQCPRGVHLNQQLSFGCERGAR